ncbi:MAG: hypothetical protein IJ157_06865 [Clostridia bacterium]|nr:hypothetical protein [Clostridia bacterium]
MRDLLCVLLSLILFCSCVFAGSLPERSLPPKARQSAWWSLLFPGFFQGGGNSVTFDWPLLRRIARLFA